MNVKGLILFLYCILFWSTVQAQSVAKDSAFGNVSIKADTTVTIARKDSVIKKKHDPRVATRHSAFIPVGGRLIITSTGKYRWCILPLVFLLTRLSLTVPITNKPILPLMHYGWPLMVPIHLQLRHIAILPSYTRYPIQ